RPSAVVGAIIAVDSRGATEFGHDYGNRLAPGIAHVGLDLGNSAVERAEQIGEAALDGTLVDVSVPAVECQRPDPRTLGLRQELRRRRGRLGVVFAYLLDAADLDREEILGRVAGDTTGARNRGEPDALFESARQGQVGVAIKIEEAHRRLVADRRQSRRDP